MTLRNKIPLALILLALCLPGCVDRWSAAAPDGSLYADAEPECRARARDSAAGQLPFYPFEAHSGPAGFPPDTRRDIENRETALCLKQRGFTLTREWRSQ